MRLHEDAPKVIIQERIGDKVKVSSYWPVPELTRAELALGRLHKMASNTQEIVLTSEQLIKYRTNYWVRKLDSNNPRNHTGKDLLIYCDNDYGRLNTGSILVCLWNDHWHKIARPDHPILGEEIPWLHT